MGAGAGVGGRQTRRNADWHLASPVASGPCFVSQRPDRNLLLVKPEAPGHDVSPTEDEQLSVEMKGLCASSPPGKKGGQGTSIRNKIPVLMRCLDAVLVIAGGWGELRH